ncbi:alpha/beta hydrolase fold domain-containing protein [Oceaniglobus roseus]|uniref:alpha/beta hydrolase fold domain-containing protein n=1 Tax=Oceaniglobus roseus TaxID=1737570 RepID=UPI000C7F72E8|nr:alpha/beta hydrolase fold domain-containing protein [Kandeliimicrobium roseum]
MSGPRGWSALQRHIADHPVEGSPEEMRAAFASLAPKGPDGRAETIGGVRCTVFGNDGPAPLLWAHGGGLVFGSPATHAALADRLAGVLNRPVILPDYRLAPEHPWPASLEDMLAVLDALPGTTDLGGDSAGGQLALLSALRRPGKAGRLILISPNTDRSGQSTTRQRNSARDAMNDDAQDLALARLSFGESVADHPDGSPLNADLSALPPVWITACTDEVLLDDTLLLIPALGRAGVPVQADIRQGLCHLWPLWPDALPDGAATFDALAAFAAAPG